MSLDDDLRITLEGIRQADVGRAAVMRRLEAAWAARTDLDDQLTDLRETIGELQRLVLEQGEQLTRLRERLNGGAAQQRRHCHDAE